jgi:hypothetical protein
VESVSWCQGEQLEKAAGFLEAPLVFLDAARIPNRYPEAAQQPDTYSLGLITQRLFQDTLLLPGRRWLRAGHPLTSSLPREIGGGAINSARSYKAQARRLVYNHDCYVDYPPTSEEFAELIER